MEARMLSLFDDEDFLPQEKPKQVKPKKSPDKQEATQDDAKTVAAATIEDSPATDQPEQEPGATPVAEQQEETKAEPVQQAIPATQHPDSDEAGPTQEEQQDAETATPLTEETPQEQHEPAAGPIPAAANEPENKAEQETPVLTTGTIAEAVIPPAAKQPEDDELNRQILSEIMLSDYSAFIHKDYPFDLKTVEVVKKDKEIKVPEPAKAPAAITGQEEVFEEEEEEEEDNAAPVAPLPEWNLDKRYYTIGEVSQLFKVNTSHIRFWTNEFKLRPRTTRKGDRLYSPEDIAQLRLIHHLVKEKKHTIKGAKEKLKAEKGSVGNKLDLKDALVSLKEMLIQIKEQL